MSSSDCSICGAEVGAPHHYACPLVIGATAAPGGYRCGASMRAEAALDVASDIMAESIIAAEKARRQRVVDAIGTFMRKPAAPPRRWRR